MSLPKVNAVVMPKPPELPDNPDELLDFVKKLVVRKHVGQFFQDEVINHVQDEVYFQLDRANERYDLKLGPARQFWTIVSDYKDSNLQFIIEPTALLNYEVRIEPATNTAKWMPEGAWKASITRREHGDLFVMAPSKLHAVVALARLVEARHG